MPSPLSNVEYTGICVFKDNFVLHLGGPNEQFGVHENFFWGKKVSYPGCRVMREYLAFARYSGWGKSIQIGANFNNVKQCKFQSTL